MANFFEFINGLEGIIPFLRAVVIVVIVFIVFDFILNSLKKTLLKKAKRKKQVSDIEIFSKIFKYTLLLILIIFAIFSYAGSWSGLGLIVGLLSAALGWALQKPISGVAAWILIVANRPFEIGDRIIIGDVRGDVVDLTLTHIHLKEIGGIVPGEERSGRIVLIPNYALFERNIINYNSRDEFVLDQVVVTVTYESDLDKAMKIPLKSAVKHTKDFVGKVKKEPYTRIFFQPSGIDVHVRYFAPATKLQEISSEITKEIHGSILKVGDVEIAYPHTEVVFRRKT
ncbi:MAG: mechanosensitive ion channel family protein [Candidatus Altiarchaeota archaeon]|nr:mechanosensitive ion channel family protein [Candidatus Altiarchaeota archaeon]